MEYLLLQLILGDLLHLLGSYSHQHLLLQVVSSSDLEAPYCDVAAVMFRYCCYCCCDFQVVLLLRLCWCSTFPLATAAMMRNSYRCSCYDEKFSCLCYSCMMSTPLLCWCSTFPLVGALAMIKEYFMTCTCCCTEKLYFCVDLHLLLYTADLLFLLLCTCDLLNCCCAMTRIYSCCCCTP